MFRSDLETQNHDYFSRPHKIPWFFPEFTIQNKISWSFHAWKNILLFSLMSMIFQNGGFPECSPSKFHAKIVIQPTLPLFYKFHTMTNIVADQYVKCMYFETRYASKHDQSTVLFFNQFKSNQKFPSNHNHLLSCSSVELLGPPKLTFPFEAVLDFCSGLAPGRGLKDTATNTQN